MFPTAPIGALFEVKNGATPKSDETRFWDGEVPWVTPADLGRLEKAVISQGAKSITIDGLKSCGTQIVPKGSLILSIRAPIGHLAVAENDMCFNQGCRGLIPRKHLNPDFSFWALSSAKPALQNAGQGTTFMELGRGRLRAVHLSVPDLPTQKRIAKFLDRETARIDELIVKKERLVDAQRNRLNATLKMKVLGGASVQRGLGGDWLQGLPEGWRLTPLKHLVSVMGGATPSKDREDFWIGEIPWVSPKDMKTDIISEVPDHVSEAAVDSSALQMIPEQAVLIVVRGMILARFVPVCRLGVAATINQDMKALLPRKTVIRGDYLQRMLQGFGDVLMSFIEEAAHGTKKLRSDALFGLKFPVPPLDLQKQIVDEYERLRVWSEKVSEVTLASIERLREYRAALITAAVTGQIDVDTYAKASTTSAMLDRIAAEVTG